MALSGAVIPPPQIPTGPVFCVCPGLDSRPLKVPYRPNRGLGITLIKPNTQLACNSTQLQSRRKTEDNQHYLIEPLGLILAISWTHNPAFFIVLTLFSNCTLYCRCCFRCSLSPCFLRPLRSHRLALGPAVELVFDAATYPAN